VRLIKLSFIMLLTGTALFAQHAGAEENLNTDSHLPFVPQDDLSITPLAPQLTADQRIPTSAATTTAHDPNDLWHRIRSGFAMRELDSPLVARHEKWYASRPDYMARMTERSPWHARRDRPAADDRERL
jgi:membrane-bound lytic murein transglycosylase D